MAIQDDDWLLVAQVYAGLAAASARLAAAYGPQGGDGWAMFRQATLDYQEKARQALINAGVPL